MNNYAAINFSNSQIVSDWSKRSGVLVERQIKTLFTFHLTFVIYNVYEIKLTKSVLSELLILQVWFCDVLLRPGFEFYRGYRVPITRSIQVLCN